MKEQTIKALSKLESDLARHMKHCVKADKMIDAQQYADQLTGVRSCLYIVRHHEGIKIAKRG